MSRRPYTSFELWVIRFLVGWVVGFLLSFQAMSTILGGFDSRYEGSLIIVTCILGGLYFFSLLAKVARWRLQRLLKMAAPKQTRLRRYWTLCTWDGWNQKERNLFWAVWQDAATIRSRDPKDVYYAQWQALVTGSEYVAEETPEVIEVTPEIKPLPVLVEPARAVEVPVVEQPATPIPPKIAPAFSPSPAYQIRTSVTFEAEKVEPKPIVPVVPDTKPVVEEPAVEIELPAHLRFDKWQQVVTRKQKAEPPSTPKAPVQESLPVLEVIPTPEPFVVRALPTPEQLTTWYEAILPLLEKMFQPIPQVSEADVLQSAEEQVSALESLDFAVPTEPATEVVTGMLEEPVVEYTPKAPSSSQKPEPEIESKPWIPAIPPARPLTPKIPAPMAPQPMWRSETKAEQPQPYVPPITPKSAFPTKPPKRPVEFDSIWVIAKPILIGIVTLGVVGLLIVGGAGLYRYLTLPSSVPALAPEAQLSEPGANSTAIYTIDLGDRETLKEANRDLEGLRNSGYEAYLYRELKRDGKIKLRVGRYSTKRDAQVVGRKLIDERFTKRFAIVSPDTIEQSE
ncbi:MAG: hypothetical protein OEM52_07055 [bacterium]|nr:hypothetical protein [bacterium]